MTTVDLTVELLKQIRDGVHETNARINETNARLDQTNARLDQTNARLDRTRTELVEAIGGLDGRVGRLEGQFSEALGCLRILAERDDRVAGELDDIRRRVQALEARDAQRTP